MNATCVFACLDDKPGGQSAVFVLVGGESQLKRVDSVGEVRGSLPVGLEGSVNPARLVVRLCAGVACELRPSKRVAGGATGPAPNKQIRLGGFQIPAMKQVI